jgi:hypothetical protein
MLPLRCLPLWGSEGVTLIIEPPFCQHREKSYKMLRVYTIGDGMVIPVAGIFPDCGQVQMDQLSLLTTGSAIAFLEGFVSTDGKNYLRLSGSAIGSSRNTSRNVLRNSSS